MSRAHTSSVVALVALIACACSERDPVELIRAIPNPDPDAGERFGRVLGGGGRLVVPVELDDAHGFPGAGTVYVFDPDTGDLLHTITSPMPQTGAHFGEVVLAGSKLMIAAPYADVGSVVDAGAIYVFSITGELLQEIPNPAPVANDHFGLNMISLQGGFAARVAGPTGDGRVYVYQDRNGRELAGPIFDDPSTKTTEGFGTAMHWTGQHLLVGSPGAGVGGVGQAGLIRAYNLDEPSPLAIEIPNPTPSEGARFGAHLGAAGPLPVASTAAGSPVLVVLDENASEILYTYADAGVIRGYGDPFGLGFVVLHPDDGAGSVTLYASGEPRAIPNPDPQDGDRFGSEAFLDFGLYVLSPADDRDGLVDAGSVYRVPQGATQPSSERFLYVPSPSAGAAFGTDIRRVSDAMIVSAPGEDYADVDEAGAAYLYADASPLLVHIQNPEPGAHDRFGEHALQGLGDTFVIGARADDPAGVVDAGSVYLYRLTLPE